MDCLFCSIAEKKIPSTIVYEDKDFLAFNDIKPQAPVHVLVIPKKHITNIDEVQEEDREFLSGLYFVIQKIAKEQDIVENGYRVVTNVGEDGGQTVEHLHFHILGGRSLQWPPG